VFNRLFPAHADNAYRGHKLALVILGLLLLIKGAISLGSIFNGYNAASSADGIPIDTYTPAGAQTVVALFALIGQANFIITLIGVIVLARYRSLVPLMFLLLLIQQVSRKLILELLPIVRTGAPPGTGINLAILGLIVIGFALSLWSRERTIATSA